MNRRAGMSMLVLLLIGVALSSPLHGQEGNERRFEERVDVDIVNIPVVVTDQSGDPVLDLSASDFILSEDGKKRKIANFSLVSAVSEPVEVGSSPPGTPPPSLPEAGQIPGLVLFVDNLNILPVRRNAVLEQVRKYVVDRLDPAIPVMVVSMGGRLRIHQPFTLDRTRLAENLAEMAMSLDGRAFDPQNRDEQITQVRESIQEIVRCRSGGLCGRDILEGLVRMTIQRARAFALAEGWQAQASLYSLKLLCRSLALTPGRKVVLYISDGFPLSPGKDLLMELRDKLDTSLLSTADAGQSNAQLVNRTGIGATDQSLMQMVDRALSDPTAFNLSSVLNEISSQATSNEIRIYSVHARMLSSGAADASISNEIVAAGKDSAGVLMREGNYRAPLQIMARDTGGLSLQGSARTDQVLDTIVQDTGTYYSLGFRSPNVKDGNEHTIKVKLKGKGRKITIRHPHRYLAKTDAMKRADQLVGSIVVDEAINPFEISLEIGTGEVDEEERTVIPTTVLIPIRNLAFVERKGEQVTDLILALAVIDRKGKVDTLREYPIPVKIPGDRFDEAQDQSFPVSLKIVATEGENRLVVGVWEENSSVASFTRRTFRLAE